MIDSYYDTYAFFLNYIILYFTFILLFKCNLTVTLVETSRYIIFVIFIIFKAKAAFSALFTNDIFIHLFICFFICVKIYMLLF